MTTKTAVSPANPDDPEKALQASEVVAGMVLGSSFWCGELVKAHKDLGHLNEKLKPYAVANALDSASEKSVAVTYLVWSQCF